MYQQFCFVMATMMITVLFVALHKIPFHAVMILNKQLYFNII